MSKILERQIVDRKMFKFLVSLYIRIRHFVVMKYTVNIVYKPICASYMIIISKIVHKERDLFLKLNCIVYYFRGCPCIHLVLNVYYQIYITPRPQIINVW